MAEPVAEAGVVVGMGGDLKEDKRFWAEDLRRMDGRDWWPWVASTGVGGEIADILYKIRSYNARVSGLKVDCKFRGSAEGLIIV
jgi:hypothetical protein